MSETSPGSELLAEGRRRYEAGDLADAEPLARRALELRPADGPAEPRAEALQLVAEIAYSLGRYSEAQDLAADARRLRDGGTAEAVAETDNLLGVIALARGDVAAGLGLIRTGFEAREVVLGPDASDTIESLNNLAAATARDGRIAEAIELSREALARGERGFDGPHRQLAVALNGLAVKLDRTEETRAEAGMLYARALAAAEAALGPEHPLVATLLSNVATQRLNAGDIEAARPYVARSIDLHERRHGRDHPNTATALLNAVELARKDDDPTTARDLLERVLAIRLATFGPTEIRTRQVIVRLLNVLGGIMATDQTVVADGILILEVDRAVAPNEDGTPQPAPDPALVDRLRAYLDRRRAVGAALDDETRRRALDRARLSGLAADAAFMAGDRDAARFALEEAIARISDVRGPDDLGLVEPLRRRAAVARADARRDDAIRDEERALAILGAAYGGTHPYVLRARMALVRDLQQEYGAAAARPVLAALRAAIDAELSARPANAEATHVQIRELLDRHLALIPTDAVADPIGRSERRRRAMATVGALADRVLGSVPAIDWAGIRGAHGPAIDVPTDLRLLLAEDAVVVADAGDRLSDAILQQGALFPATVAAIEPLRAIATDPRVAHRTVAIQLLAGIVANGAVRSLAGGRAVATAPGEAELVRAIERQVAAVSGLFDRLARDPDPGTREAAAAARTLIGRAGAVPPPGRAN